MTGVSASRGYKVGKEGFLRGIDSLNARFRIVGPVRAGRDGSQTVFKELSEGEDLFLQYRDTAISPGKYLFFKPKQEILSFEVTVYENNGRNTLKEINFREAAPSAEKCLLVGVHPCDLNAILYLDKTYCTDPYYSSVRENTVIIALNCTEVSDFCFCSSVGTGPHLKAETGYDVLLTDLGEDYLLEIKSEKAGQLFDFLKVKADEGDFEAKARAENALLERFKKRINLEKLDEILMNNLDHRVWEHTAEKRCLSCTNCVMVCPTCFCHDIVDEIDVDLKKAARYRQWDACQDFKFAEVHGGNFRASRTARLRQFIMHKLNYTAQYGLPGTVGCGRCIRWCPTGIDLTEVANEIMKTPVLKK